MTRRLTRKEQQARTRSCLMEAAGRVFARRGLAHASVDEVAADAGFTKGAFYANFRSKEDLFLAMLEERFAQRKRALDEVLAEDGAIAEQARAGGGEFADHLRGDPEWERLFFEFAAHAARHEAFRGELVVRYRALVAQIADAVRVRSEQVGFAAGAEAADVFALMVFTAANGVALQQMLDPDGVPHDLFADMLELLTLGAMVKAEGPALAGPSA